MLNQSNTSVAELEFYMLPFIPGTFKINIDTLNEHTDFRSAQTCDPTIKLRKVSFQNEVFNLAVQLDQEPEQYIYIQVKQTELQISCTEGSHQTCLSRSAYFALYQLLSVYRENDFTTYYWPGFFNEHTGESKYLDIVNENNDLYITCKPEYPVFYKPGQNLFVPDKGLKPVKRSTINIQKDVLDTSAVTSSGAIGYCLADTMLFNCKSSHFPFLIPYTGLLTKNKTAVKQFSTYIDLQATDAHQYTPLQTRINRFAVQMKAFVKFTPPFSIQNSKDYLQIRQTNISNQKQLFALWQKVIPLLTTQPFTHHYHTFGLKYIIPKPKKKYLQTCRFSAEIPEICFLWTDKGDYFELQLQFKAAGKAFVPADRNPTFFIHAKTDPAQFYLLGSLADFHLIGYFSKYKFKLAVLKCHYPDFKYLLNRLTCHYNLQTKILAPPILHHTIKRKPVRTRQKMNQLKYI